MHWLAQKEDMRMIKSSHSVCLLLGVASGISGGFHIVGDCFFILQHNLDYKSLGKTEVSN